MSNLTRQEANEKYEEWWSKLQTEWFKVEVLQDYSGEDSGPSLQSWLNGDHENSMTLAVALAKEDGWPVESQKSPARKIRFHILERPLTPYLEWELEFYNHVNIPLAGEEVFLLEKEAVKHLKLPDGDFTVFDGKRVIQNHYDKTGLMVEASFFSGEKDVTYYLDLREKLLSLIK